MAHPRGVRRLWRWRTPLVLAVLLLSVYLARVPLLVGIARVAVHEDPVQPADYLFLLNGDAEEARRAMHAAALFRRGLAPRVAVARAESPASVRMGLYPNETDVNLALLVRHGVPRSAIDVLATPGGVTSTTDEARQLRALVERTGASRVIVVTSEYHTARARWAVRRALRGTPTEVLMSGAGDPQTAPTSWWRSERGLIVYFEEYLKFAHNWVYR